MHKGDENRLKIAREWSASLKEGRASCWPAGESLIVRIAFRRRLDVDDDGERPSRYHYEPAG